MKPYQDRKPQETTVLKGRRKKLETNIFHGADGEDDGREIVNVAGEERTLGVGIGTVFA